MEGKNVWTYWENRPGTEMAPYIRYCLKSIKERCGSDVNVIILTPENVNQYLADVALNENWRKLECIAQKIDCLRLGILHKWGGLWLDLDTVIIKPLSNLFNYTTDMKVMKWNFNNRILNGYFFAKQGNPFIAHCLNRANYILANEFKPVFNEGGGVYLGECIFRAAEESGAGSINIMSLNTFIPVEFPPQRGIWYRPDVTIETFIKPETVAIALNHSQYSQDFKNKSLEDHLASVCLFSSIFKYSEKLGSLLPL